MNTPVTDQKDRQNNRHDSDASVTRGNDLEGVVAIADKDAFLDTTQLNRLEQAFRKWADSSPRSDIRFSRQRILLVFLLIRYTGAKLNEVLRLNPFKQIDWNRHVVVFCAGTGGGGSETREVQISEMLCGEIRSRVNQPRFQALADGVFNLDPGFIRRKFYEQAQTCGFSRRLGGPEAIRKARAVELLQSNMPLPAVQMLLGHSTPGLTSSYVHFSRDEIQLITKRFMEKESARKTSARNSFCGKINSIVRGDIQSCIILTTIEGYSVTTVITNDSLERLGLRPGRLITAEVKAPWVTLQGGEAEPLCSAENKLKGTLTRITRGRINTECVVKISDMTEICAIVASAGNWLPEMKAGDNVWVLFNCFAVVLHLD